MSLPFLSVAVNGQGAVSADQLNTYEQTCNTIYDLRNFSGAGAFGIMQVYCRGQYAVADGGQGLFYWNATSVAADDNGATTIQPSGSPSAGRWIRLPITTANLPVATASQVIAGTSASTLVTPAAAAQSLATFSLIDAPIITWDMSQIINAFVTLGGNRTIAAPTNPVLGRRYGLFLAQDATGSRTVTWNASFFWGAAGTPTLTTTPNKTDWVDMICVSTSPVFYSVINKGF